MPTSIGPSGKQTKIVNLNETADIQVALKYAIYGTADAATVGVDSLYNNLATKASPTFTGNVVLPQTTSLGVLSLPSTAGADTLLSATSTAILTNKSFTISPTYNAITRTNFAFSGEVGFNSRISVETPTNTPTGSKGGLTIRANSTSGSNYLQMTDATESNQWYTLQATSTNAVYSAGTNNQASHLFQGPIQIAASNGNPPLKLNTGTLGSVTSGGIEYDGNVFYATPKMTNTTYGRGLIPAQSILVLNTTNTQTSSANASGQTVNTTYPVLGKSVYLVTGQSYFIDMKIVTTYRVQTSGGTSSASATFLLTTPGSTSCYIFANSLTGLTSVSTGTNLVSSFLSGLGASQSVFSIASTVGDSGTKYAIFQWSGVISTSSPGVFSPAMNLAAVTPPGFTASATMSVQPGSYCNITPLGSNSSQTNIGGWA